jgi:cephalosporin hydroxylase
MKEKIRGQFEYKQLYVLQNKNVFETFKQLFLIKKPKRIIEIGTQYGGFTLMLKDILLSAGLSDFIIRTYDVKNPSFLMQHPELDERIEIKVEDIFNYHPFSIKEEKIKELNDFMSDDTPNIILCDGGNKIKEFNVFSEIIKSGDIIMAHDYAYDIDKFENEIKGNVWNWMEIQESDISECSKRNNLNFYMGDEFQNVAWVCKEKNE